MPLPAGIDVQALLAVTNVVERARLLAQAAHRGQCDKAGSDYADGHLRDVHRRAQAYGAAEDEQAAAWLHDIVEDTAVTEADLLLAGFVDRTLLTVDLMTKRAAQPADVYYARLRAYEPARRLKLDADVASNADPERLALVQPAAVREQLAEKYARARALLTL